MSRNYKFISINPDELEPASQVDARYCKSKNQIEKKS